MKNNDDTEAWNHRLGTAWAAQLRRHGSRPTDTVAELGPGFSDKLARGLAALAFGGKVVLVEPNAAAGAWAVTGYRRWLPYAEVARLDQPVPASGGLWAGAVDVLAANHLLDDLILHAALLPEVRAQLFSEMRPGANCTPLFINEWRALVARPARLEQLRAQVAGEFTRYVAALRPRLVLLNQYPSWRHEQHGLQAIHTHAEALLQLLAAQLAAAGYEVTVWPDAGALPLGAWLIGKGHAV